MSKLNNSNMPEDLGEIEPTPFEERGEEGNHGLPKNLSFKDFMVVDYTPGMGEYISYQAMKRHRGRIGEAVETDEALSHAQRIKMSMRMKKMAKRIKIARDRAMRRSPDQKVAKKRAQRAARKMIIKRLTKGQDKGDLTFSRRQEIEKRLAKMGPRIDRLAKRLIPVIRKKDRERKQAARAAKNQSSN